MRMVVLLLNTALALGMAGCASTRATPISSAHRRALNAAARACLKAAVQYKSNPALRVAGIEALERAAPDEGLAWIRLALQDAHPAVRFAACVAVGQLRDEASLERVRRLQSDEDANVRVACLFALHRLGDSSRTGKLASYLLDHDDPLVRRNTAMVLGLLGEPGAIKLLARAMRDAEQGVRQYALEALALLGNAEARQELVFMTNRGVGAEEVFAINALAQTQDPRYRDTFLYKLSAGTHLETRIAAGAALGALGTAEGLDLALSSLESSPTRRRDPNDTRQDQRFRVRLMALGALGAIKHAESLAALERALSDPRDPRLQVAAARSVLHVLGALPTGAFPLVVPISEKGR